MAIVLHGFELVAIEEVGGGAAVAEEEPIFAGCAERAALVQEGSEGSDARAGTDHDDGGRSVRGQAEALVGLDVNGQRVAGLLACGEHGGADTAALAVVGAVADDGYGGVDFAGVGEWARGDAVEARGQLGEQRC